MSVGEAAAACLLAGQAWGVAAATTCDASAKVAAACYQLFLAPGVDLVLHYSGARLVLRLARWALPAWLPLHARSSGPPLPTSAATPAALSTVFAPTAKAPGAAAYGQAAAGAGSSLGPQQTADQQAVRGSTADADAETDAEEGQQPEGEAGAEEQIVDAGYERLPSAPALPQLADVPAGAAGDSIAGFFARQLSEAGQEAEPLLLTVPSSTSAEAGGMEGAASAAATAAADTFEAEAAAATATVTEGASKAAACYSARPASVVNAEAADELLAGHRLPDAGLGQEQRKLEQPNWEQAQEQAPPLLPDAEPAAPPLLPAVPPPADPADAAFAAELADAAHDLVAAGGVV